MGREGGRGAVTGGQVIGYYIIRKMLSSAWHVYMYALMYMQLDRSGRGGAQLYHT